MEDKETCKWTHYDDDYDDDYYDTECKNTFFFMNDHIQDNEFKYCPYCGKPIEEVKSS